MPEPAEGNGGSDIEIKASKLKFLIMQISIDFKQITDWNSFHKYFYDLMGFPSFYGSNLDAWIDCMSYIDDPSAEMSKISVTPNECLDMVIFNFTETQTDILLGLFECVAFVNKRFKDSSSDTRIKIVPLE